MKLPSKFQIDETVYIETEVNTIKCEVAAIKFTEHAVQYDIDLNPGGQHPCIVYDVDEDYIIKKEEVV